MKHDEADNKKAQSDELEAVQSEEKFDYNNGQETARALPGDFQTGKDNSFMLNLQV